VTIEELPFALTISNDGKTAGVPISGRKKSASLEHNAVQREATDENRRGARNICSAGDVRAQTRPRGIVEST
jgi:hypothetical protein